jgi:hypothetical protein
MLTLADRGRHVLGKLQKDGLWDIAETVEGEAAMIPAQVCAKWLKWAEENQGWPKRFIKAEHAMVHETLPFLHGARRRGHAREALATACRSN